MLKLAILIAWAELFIAGVSQPHIKNIVIP
jgi:hypothetical protein